MGSRVAPPCRSRLRLLRRVLAAPLASTFGVFGSDRAAVDLEDGRVVHEAVDRRGRRHWALEDAAPLAEDEVARDEEGATLVALGHEREEHLGLVSGLLHVSDVVEDHEVVDVELPQRARERKIATSGEEVLYELVGRGEED